jgi:DNA-binding response OmpR family regulator
MNEGSKSSVTLKADALICGIMKGCMGLFSLKAEDVHFQVDESASGVCVINGLVEKYFDVPIRAGDIFDYIGAQLSEEKCSVLVFGKNILDPQDGLYTFAQSGRDPVRLTEKEVSILRFLSENKGLSIDRQALLSAVWGYVDGVETHTLETHIYRLRQKIEIDPSQPQILLTDEDGTYSIG